MTALVSAAPDRLAAAYAFCEQMARAHYENFPVASRLLPGAMRPHIAAIYAFARAADDFADEPGLENRERLARLDDWHARLTRAAGTTVDADADRIFLALAHTIEVKALPVSLFEDLLSAFRQDVTTKRHDTWADVLDYCRRSANPVGRLVLRVAGHRDARMDAASDAICTALQLTNFWQDFARDWDAGRLYIPLEDRDLAGARDDDLDARRMTPEWKRALHDAAERTRALFEQGRPLCDAVSGRLRWELRLTWLGGMRILDELGAGDFEVFERRPTLAAGDIPRLLWAALRWKTSHGGSAAGRRESAD